MKVYIKSATNISDYEAKIAKKQAEIDKKEAWIQKKEASIAKRYKIIEPAVTPEEFARVQNYVEFIKNHNSYRVPEELSISDISRKFPWGEDVGHALYGIRDDASSIYNSNEAIKEAQKIIDNYNSKISALTEKANEIDRIPDCLKEFMNDIIARWDEHDLRIKNEGKPFYQQLRHDAWVILYGETSSGSPSVEKAKLAELYPNIPERDRYYSYRDPRREQFDEDYIERPFEREYGSLKYARSIWDLSDEQIHKQNQRDGENLVLDLLKRVTKITGPVRDWNSLRVTRGNVGAVINGIVVGEDGTAEVKSILASGPIQRLHVRTLVHEVK